jgi:hypothetical protein
LKIAEGLGGPLTYFFACFLTTVMHCTVGDKNENKEVGTILNLFHKFLGTSVFLLLHVLLLIFLIIFCDPSCSADHLNEVHGPLVVHGPHFGNRRSNTLKQIIFVIMCKVQNTNKVMYCLYSIILTFKVEILTISYL